MTLNELRKTVSCEVAKLQFKVHLYPKVNENMLCLRLFFDIYQFSLMRVDDSYRNYHESVVECR